MIFVGPAEGEERFVFVSSFITALRTEMRLTHVPLVGWQPRLRTTRGLATNNFTPSQLPSGSPPMLDDPAFPPRMQRVRSSTSARVLCLKPTSILELMRAMPRLPCARCASSSHCSAKATLQRLEWPGHPSCASRAGGILSARVQAATVAECVNGVADPIALAGSDGNDSPLSDLG